MPFGLSEKTMQLMHNVFKNYEEIDAVIIYGSRAKGTFHIGSDIDITLSAPTMNLERLLQLENELDDLYLPYKMDISLFHKLKDPSLIEHINRVGKILYSNSSHTFISP